MKTRILLLTLTTACLALQGCDAAARLWKGRAPSSSVLRVRSTLQYPDVRHPWLRKPPFNREGIGTLLEGGLVLVTADMADHATSIRLESPDKVLRCEASAVALDLECNLALLRPSDPGILKGRHPLRLEPLLPAGTSLRILQLEPNGSAALSDAVITTADVAPYPSGAAYLLYRATTTIPQRDGSFVVPALHQGGLAGLVTRYEPRTQAAEIIPSPLIGRFLAEASKPGFRGLARAGITWSPVHGTTLREWLGISAEPGGVSIISLDKSGPAAKAGLRKGDIIVTLGGRQVDSDGNYEHEVLGKTVFSNLVSLEHSPGETIPFGYLRPDGKGGSSRGEVSVTLAGKNPSSEISSSLIEAGELPYLFYGGLLFLELSRPYLREWGNNWPSEAPQNLVALDAFQDEMAGDRRRFVILSGILPSEQTLGSERLTQRLVERINGRPILSLDDVAEARRHPLNGFHRIDLEGSAGPIFLDAATLDAEEARLKAQYGIPGNDATKSPTP